MFAIGIVVLGIIFSIFLPSNRRVKVKEVEIAQNRYVVPEKININENRETDAYYIDANIDNNVCGIKVFSPLPNQKVSFPLEVSGYVNGCNWIPTNGVAGTLEIRDNVKSLTQNVLLLIENDDLTLPAYFKIKIGELEKPSGQNGVLIFRNNVINEANQGEIFQVPVNF